MIEITMVKQMVLQGKKMFLFGTVVRQLTTQTGMKENPTITTKMKTVPASTPTRDCGMTLPVINIYSTSANQTK